MATLLLASATATAGDDNCTLLNEDTFPKGEVWFRIATPTAEGTSNDTALDLNAQLLVSGVRSDGVLVQNKQARYPRLISWKILGRNELSTDGRRTWRRACLS